MTEEIIKWLKIDTCFGQVRVGRALTTIHLTDGREFVIKNDKELDELTQSVLKAKEFLESI